MLFRLRRLCDRLTLLYLSLTFNIFLGLFNCFGYSVLQLISSNHGGRGNLENLQMRSLLFTYVLCIRVYPPHSPVPDSQHELVCSSSQTLTHSQSNVLIRDSTIHTEVIAMTQGVGLDTHTPTHSHAHTRKHTHTCKNSFFF